MQRDKYKRRHKQKMDAFTADLEGLCGTRRALIEDALSDYCRIAVIYDDVADRVVREGTIKNGDKNPEVTTMHSLLNEKNALLPKLLKYLEPTEKQDSGLDGFIGS